MQKKIDLRSHEKMPGFNALLHRYGLDGVILLAGVFGGAVSLVTSVGKAHQGSLPAGKLISAIAPLVGGKGGGKPDGARGGGRDAAGLPPALSKDRDLIAAGRI